MDGFVSMWHAKVTGRGVLTPPASRRRMLVFPVTMLDNYKVW
jgi:hypothetical protein